MTVRDVLEAAAVTAVSIAFGVLAAWALGLSGCASGLPGDYLPHTPETESWHTAARDLVADWRADRALPSLEANRCRDAIAHLEIRTATEDEWIDQLRLCPRMPDGCSTQCGRDVTGCATGTVLWDDWHPRVYLSPGESADGHGITVRHEVAHVLSACTSGGDLDAGHRRPEVWGSSGVVWRR